MKLEVGKTYVTRAGDKVTIKGFDLAADCPYVGVVRGDWFSWYEAGNMYPDESDSFDLVSEYVEPPKPREWWIALSPFPGVLGTVHFTEANASLNADPQNVVHVREVLP